MKTDDARDEWIRFYQASALSYRVNALAAVFENDGIDMLRQVIKKLDIERTEDFIVAECERNKP